MLTNWTIRKAFLFIAGATATGVIGVKLAVGLVRTMARR
jgi:hypothetical protein